MVHNGRPLEIDNKPFDYIKSNLIVEPQSPSNTFGVPRPDFEGLISYGPYGVTLVVSGT